MNLLKNQGSTIYQYPTLLQGTLLRRYKRFFADVLIGGESKTCHCPNTGPMTGLLDNEPQVLVSPSEDPNRKTGFTLEMIKSNGVWVGVHSSFANKMVKNALELGLFPEVGNFTGIYQEVAENVILSSSQSKRPSTEDGGSATKSKKTTSGVKKQKKPAVSRMDFVLSQEPQPSNEVITDAKKSKRRRQPKPDASQIVGRRTIIEVKSVTLHVQGDGPHPRAEFPDTVSERAQKHIKFLTEVAKKGKDDAVMLYLIQRGDCRSFSPCLDKDPVYCQLVCDAIEAGVKVLPYSCTLEESGRVFLNGLVKLDLPEKHYSQPAQKTNK